MGSEDREERWETPQDEFVLTWGHDGTLLRYATPEGDEVKPQRVRLTDSRGNPGYWPLPEGGHAIGAMNEWGYWRKVGSKDMWHPCAPPPRFAPWLREAMGRLFRGLSPANQALLASEVMLHNPGARTPDRLAYEFWRVACQTQGVEPSAFRAFERRRQRLLPVLERLLGGAMLGVSIRPGPLRGPGRPEEAEPVVVRSFGDVEAMIGAIRRVMDSPHADEAERTRLPKGQQSPESTDDLDRAPWEGGLRDIRSLAGREPEELRRPRRSKRRR